MGVETDSKFHVLAVDDSLFDRKMIERLLQKSSCQVTTVDSGSKALEFLGLRLDNDPNAVSTSPQIHQEVEINLIITDYCMPGMTGYDLLKKVKESAAFKSIPVVIMSSENVPARISRCLEEGAEEFFLKPVKLADLTKLKPHMMKTKLKKETKVEENAKIEEEEEASVIEILSLNQELESEKIEPMLKPHMMKTKFKNQTKEEENADSKPKIEEEDQKDSAVIDILPINQELESEKLEPMLSSGSNKRKAMEEVISSDRSRPKYIDIRTTV